MLELNELASLICPFSLELGLILCLIGVIRWWMDEIEKIDSLYPLFGSKNYKKY